MGHGTFSREMMLPALLWLFITPGKCGLCYFLIRLVLEAEGPAPGQRGEGHLTAHPPVPADRGHPPPRRAGSWGPQIT